VHPIDRLATVLMRLDRSRLGVFPDGWGDDDIVDRRHDLPAPDEPIADIDVVWGRKEEHRGVRVRRGTFASPAAEILPIDARAVPIELVQPSAESSRLVVLLPAWNDHGFETRRQLATLLADRGVGSLMFDIPFYGARRITRDGRQAIRTVAEFLLMGEGAIAEARSILGAMSVEHQVGVSGYSMGGNLAALVSSSVPFPVATSPQAASHSPGPVYLDGVLRTAVHIVLHYV
jgi:hypothetical protein